MKEDNTNITKTGKYIILEGPNGCGKSHNLDSLIFELRNKHIPVYGSREPSAFPTGYLLESYYLKKKEYNNFLMVTLFAADRYEQLIAPFEAGTLFNLNRGYNVIQSRCFMSSMAISYSKYLEYGYEAESMLYYAYDKNMEFINLKKPDAIIYIDTDPEVIIERVNKIGNKDALERSKYLKFAKEGYDKAYKFLENKNFNMYRVDGNKSREEVFDSIQKIVLPLILE
jgi:dTMP kinase